MQSQNIDRSLFEALESVDLEKLDRHDIRPVLPFLANLLLNTAFVQRQHLLRLLHPISKMNDVISLMSIKTVETGDVTNNKPANFEACDCHDKLKLVVAEYLSIQDKIRQINASSSSDTKLIASELFDNPIYVDDISYCITTLLFKHTSIPVINIVDICETLLHLKFGTTYIVRLLANMPDRCHDVCHSIISLGERLDETAVINQISDQRAKTLRLICVMNPTIALSIRSATLQLCKMPSLTLMITIDQLDLILNKLDKGSTKSDQKAKQDATDQDETVMDVDESREEGGADQLTVELEKCYDSAIAFITGILLGVDDDTKSWFAQYIKSAQQKRIDQGSNTVLSKFRSQLLVCINHSFSDIISGQLSCQSSRDDTDSNQDTLEGSTNNSLSTNLSKAAQTKDLNRRLIRASATLRLYCALRGIGSLKLNADESDALLRLITCKPEASQTVVYFATTGVCTLLACSALLNTKDERMSAEWLKWLIKDSHYSESSYSSHGKCSISELLLLIAIHFQNNQTNQIAELVCATLEMKLQIKTSVLRCKSLFVNEVFNDRMVAEHAVKVPVTKNLSNQITEFLPVHCIHQLLESRSFSKHQISIHDWIFKQICECKKPLHNILPRLIKAYVISVCFSYTIHGQCGTNQPIPEEYIMKVFRRRLYTYENKITSSNHDDKTLPQSSEAQARSQGENDDELRIVDVEAAQILLLYYLILYEDTRLDEGGELSTDERNKMLKYSADFMMEIPVFYLLQLVRDNREAYSAIFPDLLKLVTSHYPQLCSVQHWLNMDTMDASLSTALSATGSTAPPSRAGSPRRTTLGDAAQLNELLATSIKWSTGSAPKPRRGYQAALINSNCLNGNTETSAVGRDKYYAEIRKNLIEKFIDNSPMGSDGRRDFSPIVKTLNQLLILPKEEIWQFVQPFIENFPKIIQVNAHHHMSDDDGQESDRQLQKLIQLTCKVWWKFNTVFPRKLWVMTVNALKRTQIAELQCSTVVEHSWEELVLDPLIVLRCDNRVFRCIEVLTIMLHILSAFLAASKRSFQDHIHEQHWPDTRALEELRVTLIHAQTSAAIQILLEFCLPNDLEQEALIKRELCEADATEPSASSTTSKLNPLEASVLDKFNQSVTCICEHLHQVFIGDTNLAKLVHFQTYTSDLLATTAHKIPSMHICLDFIPELLSQPELNKQVFVIELTSHLCERYAIIKSLNVAKLCFNVSHTMLQLLPSHRRAAFFIPVLPALLRICKVFPILREDAHIILDQIQQITAAHLASTSSRFSLGSRGPIQGLDRLNWRELTKLMQSTMNSDEALFVCIQRCCLDLQKIRQSSINSTMALANGTNNMRLLPQNQLTNNGTHNPQAHAIAMYPNQVFAYGNHVINKVSYM